ncbi:VOC family protein [Pedobacter deserti]|uniref:VOC family protein n=1 Tax=Pedobacter deserti TaxID=2817382 RepID=UPI00210EA7AE|nr:VOC family protein [Pedobacter sp. SYSU D00382]
MKVLFCSAVFLLSSVFIHHSMAQSTQKKVAVKLNHIAVYVADLQKATDFYKNVFDLEIIPEPFKDNRHTWFTLGPAGQLHLIQGAKPDQVHDKNEHLCFSVASMDSFVKGLDKMGIRYENWAGEVSTITKRPDGIQQIYFKDPDGHWLEANDDH